MKVHYSSTSLPSFKNAVLTIGTFDGVHKGHAKILQSLVKEAQKINGETVVVTFHPHPRKIINEKPLPLINTLEEKILLLQNAGIDHLVVVPFTHTFAEQTASVYVEEFLINNFHPHTIIIGYDHHFGKNRTGNFLLLEHYAHQHAFALIEIPKHVIQDVAISSTQIRTALLEGAVTIANELLGYTYFFEGTVVKGQQLGRTLGYPTANLQIENPDKLMPMNGVYAVDCEWVQSSTTNNSIKKGMMNIGVKPTVNGHQRSIEVNIFDFNENIYGQTLRVYLKRYLREEKKFTGPEALKEQLAKDKLLSSKC
jgi:riboflavin kinase / FMN adenylyltransferase